MLYYYTLPDNPYQTIVTEYLSDLIDQLYHHGADLPTDGQIDILKLPANYRSLVKADISRYNQTVPLYDIISNHIYLIDRDNIYPRIHLDNYRFIDNQFYQNLTQLKNPDGADLENIRILSNYDLDILKQTYLELFYQSYVLTSYITDCRRPSFYPGSTTSPYYTINELYYLAYDWNLTTNPRYSQEQIINLCHQIAQFDIPAQTLLDHQMYIYDSKAIGLVKHYSLFGSYYMNLYLRKNRCCLSTDNDQTDTIVNPYLNDQIKIMIKLIKNAPGFTKSHTVYRFVQKDDYLKHLKIGDIYQDPSFMSTTRNPFYYKENYAFGYILIKVKLPANIRGVGICIESYSNFPLEEEIVFPPTSRYKLVRVTDTADTSDFHGIFNLKVQKKYEFEWVDNDYIGLKNSEIVVEIPSGYVPEMKTVALDTMIDDPNIKYLSMSDRLKYFKDNYVNQNSQFSSVIGSHQYVFNLESYDSTTVYKQFFFYEVTDGIMITTANPKYGNINLMMELGSEIHVNYYFRYSVTDPSIVVDLNRPEWIQWLSVLAYVIGSRTVVIHSNYIMLSNKSDSVIEKQKKTRYTFSQNVYLYMKYGTIMYDFPEITPNFDYYQFDYLKNIKVADYITSADHTELYRIYQSSKIDDMHSFYIYVVENYPQFICQLEEKMDQVYQSEVNPFTRVSYNLDAWLYLYSRNLIKQIPSETEFNIKKGSFKKLVGDKKIPKFKNRLRSYLLKAKN